MTIDAALMEWLEINIILYLTEWHLPNILNSLFLTLSQYNLFLAVAHSLLSYQSPSANCDKCIPCVYFTFPLHFSLSLFVKFDVRVRHVNQQIRNEDHVFCLCCHHSPINLIFTLSLSLSKHSKTRAPIIIRFYYIERYSVELTRVLDTFLWRFKKRKEKQ